MAAGERQPEVTAMSLHDIPTDAVEAVLQLAVRQLQAEEWARTHPTKCRACQGTGRHYVQIWDADALPRLEYGDCGDCGGSGNA